MITEITRLHPLGDLAATRSPVSPSRQRSFEAEWERIDFLAL
jgi:hypothetical protein